MSEPPVAAVIARPDGYQVRLPVFDGPLDLLLHLIRQHRLDIFDIPIAQLTTHYLAFLEQLRRQDMEPASEFLVMAATLTSIKSRMLLPRAQPDPATEEETDPRAALMQRLVTYQRARLAALGLAALPRLGHDTFARPAIACRSDAPETPSEPPSPPGSERPWRLAEALCRLLARAQLRLPHEVWVERFTVAERIGEIVDRLLGAGARLSFQALCGEEAGDRESVITTFLALLEMCRLNLVRVIQGDRLSPVYVEARDGLGEIELEVGLGSAPAAQLPAASATE